jgi:putative membrane protein
MEPKNLTLPITIISIAVPLVVLALFYLKPPQVEVGFDLHILPAFHAALNFTTAVMLLTGYVFIRRGQRKVHQYAMMTAFVLSSVFLISYVTYHTFTEPTRFGGEGILKGIYYFILITHIILATAVLPMVLFSLTYGLQSRFDKHRRVAKWTFPIWLYVAISGVLVYLLISPYYVYA